MIYTKKLLCNDSIWDNFNKAKKHYRTITIDSDKKKFTTSDRKEYNFYQGFKIVRKKDGLEVIDARFYCATGRVVNCCLWIHLPGVISTNGSGRAGGYGYNRSSSAYQEAIKNCGIQNFPIFAGSGCNKEATLFLAKVLGLNMKNYLLIDIFG